MASTSSSISIQDNTVAYYTASGEILLLTREEIRELESTHVDYAKLREELQKLCKNLQFLGTKTCVDEAEKSKDPQYKSFGERVQMIESLLSSFPVEAPKQAKESSLPGAKPAVGASESAQTLLLRGELANRESKLKDYFESFSSYTLDYLPCRDVLAEIQQIRKALSMSPYEVPVKRCSAYGCTDENCAWRDAEPVILPPAPERTRFPPRS